MKTDVTFDNDYGTLPLDENLRSIFDLCYAGQIDVKGNYYCIHFDHKKKEYYALTKEANADAYIIGKPLREGEQATFRGETVRGMTRQEEELWNQDELQEVNVDLWGNVAVENKER